MSHETVCIQLSDARVELERVARTEWDHDGTLHCYDENGTEIGEFPTAEWCAVAKHLRWDSAGYDRIA